MCGIAGIVKWEPGAWDEPAEISLKQMSSAIAHRGPDGEGTWRDPRPTHLAALVHRRLAIIDRPGGAQPMPNEDGRVQVVFNGEIYNHAALRQELQAAGHTFRTDHSDTEVLVHGWEQWGTNLPAKLLGMFAFAIFDTRDNKDTLFLARDRMGQKPLFYGLLEDGLVFGSTIPSVLAWHEMPRRVPKEQIGLYLLLGYFPAPQTIWRDINQVLPGAWVRLRKEVVDGGIYWSKLRSIRFQGDDPQQALRTALTESVDSQLIADVPIACFLSGGIDSSIIATLMQQATLKHGRPPIQTVSIGFTESAFDETAYAAEVAKKIGSTHTRLEVRADDNLLDTLRMLMHRSLGQPFADSSLLPTYALSHAVRQLAPVVLSGDGADELFAGYDRYRAMTLLERWQGFLRFAPRTFPFKSLDKRERYRRFSAAARTKILSERYTRLIEIFPLDLAEKLLGDDIMDYFPLPEEYGLPEDAPPTRFARLRDQQEYLPGDVLWKVDSASMADALEVRSPFLDHRVVELANSLPEKLLLRGKSGKHILRQTFKTELPESIRTRAKKGFAVPIGEWFKTTLRQPLSELLFSNDSFTTTHLNKAAAEQLLSEHIQGTRDHTHRLFALLTLELWAQEFKPAIE